MWLVFAITIFLISKYNLNFKSFYPFILGISIWATIGFILANLGFSLLFVLGLLSTKGEEASNANDIIRIILGILFIVGPVVVSILGWLGGALLVFFLAWRKTKSS